MKRLIVVLLLLVANVLVSQRRPARPRQIQPVGPTAIVIQLSIAQSDRFSQPHDEITPGSPRIAT